MYLSFHSNFFLHEMAVFRTSSNSCTFCWGVGSVIVLKIPKIQLLEQAKASVFTHPVWQIKDLHSPHEIISMMGKAGQDAKQKQKLCRKVFIHISNKSVSNKLKNVSIESSKLLCLNGISFCSKSCKLKTFLLHCKYAYSHHGWA